MASTSVHGDFSMLRILGAFLAAVLTAYLVGAPLATQVMLGELRAMGLSVTLTDHLDAMGRDLLGLTPGYLPLLALALALGLPPAVAVGHRFPRWRFLLYPLAGALAVLSLHLIWEAVLGWHFLAAVRLWYGLLFQAVAGWMGGYAFLMFTGQAKR
jgi:hypothetical protein